MKKNLGLIQNCCGDSSQNRLNSLSYGAILWLLVYFSYFVYSFTRVYIHIYIYIYLHVLVSSDKYIYYNYLRKICNSQITLITCISN